MTFVKASNKVEIAIFRPNVKVIVLSKPHKALSLDRIIVRGDD